MPDANVPCNHHPENCTCDDPGTAPDPQGADEPTPDPDLDGLGRLIAQALADVGLTVGTYDICADLIYVETPSGRLFDVTLDEPSGKADVVEDEAAAAGTPDEPGGDDPPELGRWTRLTEALAAATTPLREDFEWLIGEYERLRTIMSRGQRAEAELRTIKRTDDDLTELRRLHEAATPGPWELEASIVSGEYHDPPERWAHLSWAAYPKGADPEHEWCLAGADDTDPNQAQANAELLVAMRNALPGLLAEVERRRAAAPASEDDEDHGLIDWRALNRGQPAMSTHHEDGTPIAGSPPIDWERMYLGSLRDFGDLGIAVMQAIADGASLIEVLDVVGDRLNGRDHIDEESLALFDRAKTAAGSPPPTPGPTREQVRAVIAGEPSPACDPGDQWLKSEYDTLNGSQWSINVDGLTDAVLALWSTPATVLWEQETRPTDGEPAKSYIAPPLLDCPPGTHVVVTRNEP